MEGSSFLEELGHETFGLDKDPADITPDDIRALPPVPNLRQLRVDADSRWPRRLTAEETVERAIRSERFLKMPVVHFPAEDNEERPAVIRRDSFYARFRSSRFFSRIARCKNQQ